MFIASMLLVAGAAVAIPPSPDQPPVIRDPDMEPYFDRLIHLCFNGGKINSDDRAAACHLLSRAARRHERWRVPVRMLRQEQGNERRIVQVLGKIAAVDARARDRQALPKEERMRIASMPGVVLDDTVVPELLDRVRATDRDVVDHYVIALARARDPRAVDFLRKILTGNLGQSGLTSTRFHAAVGLANLGDIEAVEWLINNIDADRGRVSHAWPGKRCSNDLATSCVEALHQVSGYLGYSTADEWRQWWSAQRESFQPKNIIQLRE
ncbi:MAG: hypothetical protein IH987_21705 [Planctomycetes bacterium]|nr:hypothetical protein [Planctomycetota bacterium]